MIKSFSISANVSEIPEARRISYSFAREAGASEKDARRTEIIVGELCANAIEYGIKDTQIDIRLELSGNSLVIECTNKSTPDTHTARALQQRYEQGFQKDSVRGRGLYIISQWTKEASFEDMDGGIKVRVVQSL
jgi:anti-sigma regulatory factor (Ser/Thr protein kinase)